MKVNLNDIIECMEYEGELLTHYYNKKTGIIIYVEDTSTSSYKAEDIEKLESFEEWEQELITMLCDFKTNRQDYIQLPSIEELDELKLMIKFCSSIERKEINSKVLELENEKEKLRKLRKAIDDSGLSMEWYSYREEAEKEIAKIWCINNSIEIE